MAKNTTSNDNKTASFDSEIADSPVKTTISWSGNLLSDIKKLADLENRSVSNFIETRMAEVRDLAKAAGKI